ncbi:MAG: hypothetical protein JWM00_578 [Candidatus Saccharibacteria bacterium]|nr:hypothetical protein [Candidatus Saccharibacteria bacterium]
MSKRKKMTLNARSLRIILLIAMLVIFAGSAFSLGFALKSMKTYAIEVSHEKIDATASNGNIQALEKTQEYLDNNKDVLEKIGLLKSTSEFPEFTVVDEVRSIAARNNIQIQNFSYGTESATAQAPASAAAPTTPAPAASTSGKVIALTVTLSASNYLDFMQFTYDLEQHLPKMKINGISITGSDTGVNIAPLTVEMYIN